MKLEVGKDNTLVPEKKFNTLEAVGYVRTRLSVSPVTLCAGIEFLRRAWAAAEEVVAERTGGVDDAA